MNLKRKILSRDAPPIELEQPASDGRRARATLRGMFQKETPVRVSGGLDGLSFEEKMALIGLQEVAPQYGRPSWKTPTKLHVVDELAEQLAYLDALDMADELAAEQAALEQRIERRARELLAERHPVQPVQMPAPVPCPPPAPPRPHLGDLTVVRNAVGQIARMEADGLKMQVTERREGRLAAVNVTSDYGPPVRFRVRRDAAGKVLGLVQEEMP